MDELYVSVWLKSLAESFITVFVPIYLLTLWFDLKTVILYYMIYFISVAVFMFLWMKLNSRIWIKKTMIIGIICFILYFFFLHYWWGLASYYVAATVWWVATALYYAAFHVELSKFTDKNEEAAEFSILKIITIMASVIWPLLWAIFITKISFDFLFLLVSILLLISVFPLFLTKVVKIKKISFSLKKILKSDTIEKWIVYGIDGILGVVSWIFWPMFIYLTLKDVFSLGAIVSLTSLIMVVFLFIIWRLTDKHKKKILKIWIWTHSISWILRLFFLSPIWIFLNNLYSSLTHLMIELPFSKIIYEKSKKTTDISSYFLYREISLAVGRVLLLCVIYFIDSIYWAFIVAFFMTFIYFLLIRKNKNNV